MLWWLAFGRSIPVVESRSRNRMSSRLYDRGDSLVLQGRGRRVLRRVTTMLAGYGLGAGETRGIANVRRALEQNKVLRRLLCLRVGTGREVLTIELELR